MLSEDELGLLTFHYLHIIEILYSFSNQNRQYVQYMIIPYTYHIDLTDVSSKLFHDQIHSLSKNASHTQLHLPKVPKILTFNGNCINDTTSTHENIEFYLD